MDPCFCVVPAKRGLVIYFVPDRTLRVLYITHAFLAVERIDRFFDPSFKLPGCSGLYGFHQIGFAQSDFHSITCKIKKVLFWLYLFPQWGVLS